MPPRRAHSDRFRPSDHHGVVQVLHLFPFPRDNAGDAHVVGDRRAVGNVRGVLGLFERVEQLGRLGVQENVGVALDEGDDAAHVLLVEARGRRQTCDVRVLRVAVVHERAKRPLVVDALPHLFRRRLEQELHFVEDEHAVLHLTLFIQDEVGDVGLRLQGIVVDCRLRFGRLGLNVPVPFLHGFFFKLFVHFLKRFRRLSTPTDRHFFDVELFHQKVVKVLVNFNFSGPCYDVGPRDFSTVYFDFSPEVFRQAFLQVFKGFGVLAGRGIKLFFGEHPLNLFQVIVDVLF